MRKLKIGGGAVIALLFGLYFLLPAPGSAPPEVADDGVPLAEVDLSYFKPDYEQSRAHFRELAGTLTTKHAGVEVGSIPVPSRNNEDLTIDYVYVPAQAAKQQLLIITSGLHGAEGPAGAAVQRAFLAKRIAQLDLTTTGVLAVHALNPYGFKHFRRVTENNVDLNRNFDVSPELFQSKNEGYRTIHDLLNPTGPATAGRIGERFFFVKAVANIAYYGMGALRQAALQGQYEFPKGIYFGGQDFEPQKELLDPLLRKTTGPYDVVVAVDLHTGYGERGKLHLFPSEAANERLRQATTDLFEGHPIDWAEAGGEFYSVTGEFSVYVGKLLRPEQLYVPMVFEYGTLNSDTTGGAVESIHRTILENQGAQFGYASENDEAEIKQRYRELFYPASDDWRAKILHDTDVLWDRVVPRIAALRP